MNKINTLQDLEEIKKRVRPLLAVREDTNFAKFKEARQIDVLVCRGTGCTAAGADEVEDAFREAIKRRGLQKRVRVNVAKIGCRGFCEKGPIMVIHPEGIFYPQVTPEKVPDIVKTTLVGQQLVDKLIYKDPVTKKKISHEHEIPFYKLQKRIIRQQRNDRPE